jgi:Tfp pilus assembly protein PilF
VPYILLGKALLKQQDPVMAKMYLDKALGLDPQNYTTHTLLGQAYRSLGQTTQAANEFRMAEQIQGEKQPKLETPQ